MIFCGRISPGIGAPAVHAESICRALDSAGLQAALFEGEPVGDPRGCARCNVFAGVAVTNQPAQFLRGPGLVALKGRRKALAIDALADRKSVV